MGTWFPVISVETGTKFTGGDTARIGVPSTLQDALTIGMQCWPVCELSLDSFTYRMRARNNLQLLTSTSLRPIPMEDGESVAQPPGFVDFVTSEFDGLLDLSRRQRSSFEASPLGRLLVPDPTS